MFESNYASDECYKRIAEILFDSDVKQTSESKSIEHTGKPKDIF